jgi:hypothetical protein
MAGHRVCHGICGILCKSATAEHTYIYNLIYYLFNYIDIIKLDGDISGYCILWLKIFFETGHPSSASIDAYGTLLIIGSTLLEFKDRKGWIHESAFKNTS